jgi:predicted RNase H-like HicB family nuclease
MRDQPHAVKVPVTASVPVECLFWTEDDGWKGSCAELALAVSGNSFEDAKKHMEVALQTRIEAVLRKDKVAA